MSTNVQEEPTCLQKFFGEKTSGKFFAKNKKMNNSSINGVAFKRENTQLVLLTQPFLCKNSGQRQFLILTMWNVWM